MFTTFAKLLAKLVVPELQALLEKELAALEAKLAGDAAPTAAVNGQ